MYKLSEKEKNLLLQIARENNTPPETIYKLIQLESKWNPAAKNPYSTARGLLQWINSAARQLGYKSSLDLYENNKSVYSQLLLARRWFKISAFGRPVKNEFDFSMINFLPGYRIKYNLTPETPLLSLPNGAKMAAANPQIKVLGDYIRIAKTRPAPAFEPGPLDSKKILLYSSLLAAAIILFKKN